MAFYNCENFFDPADDPAKDDDEFTPAGKYRYTQEIYGKKVHNIASVIAGMEPALMGMAEVENAAVLEALVSDEKISGKRYKYVLIPGPDPRGINVGLLYDPAVFRVLWQEPLHVDISGTGGKTLTRDVLHVHGIFAGEPVDVFVNHWPSRRGGEDASEAKREGAARVNRVAIERITLHDKHARIIVMGDLNDNPDDRSITHALGAVADRKNVTATGLYNPFSALYHSGAGTEVYRKQWNLFDQVMVSGAFLQAKTLRYDHAEVYKPEFIQDTYKGYEGEPHRAFKGTKWINGYSDHFPVVVYFTSAK